AARRCTFRATPGPTARAVPPRAGPAAAVSRATRRHGIAAPGIDSAGRAPHGERPAPIAIIRRRERGADFHRDAARRGGARARARGEARRRPAAAGRVPAEGPAREGDLRREGGEPPEPRPELSPRRRRAEPGALP